jgi:iron complex outermembrane receptor protein
VDPCGPTGTLVVTPGNNSALANACRAQGAPNGFQQANSQITTFTGGNVHLSPEKSDSYTAGFIYDASWAKGMAQTSRLTLEMTYYNDKIKGAIGAEDIQALLNACLAAGGTDPALCAPFTRGAGGQLNPPQNFLANLGHITTDGEDAKLSWDSEMTPIGRFSLGTQATRVNSYKSIDSLGLVAQRQVGVEVANSAIPRYRLNAQIGWGIANVQATWMVRYLSAVTEACANAVTTAPPDCAAKTDFHTLRAVTYNDAQVSWTDAFFVKNFSAQLGVNNLFGVNPPICFTCTLNGYDAGTYDLPGAFWNVRLKYSF